ncbi:hypothetical protein CLV35_1702 [Motilibacter peucedani]|uniref:Uncharacterized protein n=1 Tax=Motilibacter peucedani TaxID=598650 RepID=A0A420XPQ1_9ACTN|nr:hypothetical protein [Motilibacter peucedani]RKS75243.1 hypothetical protein CLV35_1702 [Motilibacter peucedani]
MGQWVTFLVGQRVMTVRDDEVDGIVRDAEVAPLSGLRAPITAGMQHEGQRLPLVDLREHEARADVLVMPGGEVGVVVDGVFAVVDDEALELDETLPDEPMPVYVQAVLRRSGGAAGRVFYVDLPALSGLAPPS